MPPALSLLLTFGMRAIAETVTTSVFLPIIGSQPLVGSILKEDGDVNTMIIKCPDGTISSECGFPTPVTVTAGPSMVALVTTIGNTMTVDLKCGIEASTKASCTQLYTGPASLYTSGDGIDGAKTTIWTASQSLDPGNVHYLPVTITAGASSSSTSRTTNNVAAGGLTGRFDQAFLAGFVANLIVHL